MNTFRELLESSKIIYSGSKDDTQKVMDALQDWEDDNGFPYQGYSSYTKDYKTYVIEVDDDKEYKKFKKVFDKIIKKVG